jgi:hypothetical protein
VQLRYHLELKTSLAAGPSSPADQRDLLRSAIRCVFVCGSRRTASLDGRLHVVWQGEDVALPDRGRNSWHAEPFIFPGD